MKEEIIKLLKKYTKLSNIQLEVPPNPHMGDYAFPCFQLCKKFRLPAHEIAKNLEKEITPSQGISTIEANGPYLNFFINKEDLTNTILTIILKEKDNYGSSNIGKNQKIMVEYSSPNTNKPLTLGHLRNDSIGMAVSNILEFTNYKVTKASLFNNRGAHICKSMLMYKKYGKNKLPNTKSDHFVGKFYVMFQKKSNKKLEAEILELLSKWENKDKETRVLWEKLDSWAIQGFKETYKLFGSKFDVIFKESDFCDKAKPIIKKGLKKKILKKEKDNSISIDLSKYKLPKKIIQRSNGTYLYTANDLALTEYKFNHYNLDQAIWVVGSEQDLYFQQLFKIFELLGYKWAKNCKHLSYNLVYLPKGKMKSREGKVVDADDIIEEMKNLAKEEIKKRHKLSKQELEKRSLAIGLAALKFYLLKYDTSKNIHFNPKKSLSFEGDTGPYVQYTIARISSILKKSQPKKLTQFPNLNSLEEHNLINKLSSFPITIEKSTAELKPHLLTTYLLELSHLFNEFYHVCPILKAQEDLKHSRLNLIKATSIVLKNGLKLLNIPILESM